MLALSLLISLAQSTHAMISTGTSSAVVTVVVPSLHVDDIAYPPITGNPRKVGVYLPPEYVSTNTKRYPCLYMLHQWGSDYTELELEYQPILDDLIISLTLIEPMIVVMPDVSYFPYICGMYTTFTLDGHVMDFESYIVNDVVPYIDSMFLTDTSSVKKRGIAGYEWGGYGAAKFGTKHSSLFGSFSSFLGELNMQQNLDAIFGFLLLQIPELQVGGTYILPSQRTMFSPFNKEICSESYYNELLWMFSASAAWSPQPPVSTNPGYLPTSNPLSVNDNFYPVPLGLTAPDSNMSVNLPYDSELNFVSTVTVAWNLQRIYEITPPYAPTLATQDIWLGGTNVTIDPILGVFAFVDQPSTAQYDQLLTSLSITHTYVVYPGFIWVPSPSYLGYIPPSSYAPQIQDQIRFHNTVFNP